MNIAGPAQGLDPVYLNTTVEFGTSDVGPLVLGIKNSGADAAYLPMVAESNLALVQGLEQNGVEMKFNALMTGYGQNLLDSPVGEDVEAEHLLHADLQAGRGEGHGDQAVPGRPEEGRDHRRSRLRPVHRIHHLRHGHHRARADGQEREPRGLRTEVPRARRVRRGRAQLPAYPVGLDSFGKFPETGCIYGAQVKDGKFVVVNKGKPVIGKLVGNKDALDPGGECPQCR